MTSMATVLPFTKGVGQDKTLSYERKTDCSNHLRVQSASLVWLAWGQGVNPCLPGWADPRRPDYTLAFLMECSLTIPRLCCLQLWNTIVPAGAVASGTVLSVDSFRRLWVCSEIVTLVDRPLLP